MRSRPRFAVHRFMRGRLLSVWFTPWSGPHASIAMLTLGRRGTIQTALFRHGRPPRRKVWRR